jgi:2-dehydro-3-deoxyglucarate aldolase/4-hydroxy-2-oxoheptanedioate aldolase
MPGPGNTETLKSRLAAGETLFGSLVTIASTDVAEIMAISGFDYLWIDLEHGAIDITHAQQVIQAVGARCPCLVRVPENRDVWFKKVLDLGCAGVVVPQVQTAVEVRAAVESCLYPPVGRRSVGVGRAQGYGASFADYIQRANDDLLIVVQIEHWAAVTNLGEILRVPGVGCLLVGPFDLSGSMGLLGQVTHPEVEAAISTVRTACAHAAMPCGVFTVDGDSARARAAEGFRLVAIGTDAGLLGHAARDAIARAKMLREC